MYYRAVKKLYKSEDLRKHFGYAIEAVTGSNVVVKTVDDVFLDELEAIKFARCCNNQKVSLVHIEDVIADRLSLTDA